MSSQILKTLAALLLIGSLILAGIAFRLGRAPQPAVNAPETGGLIPAPQEAGSHKIVVASRAIQGGEEIHDADITLAPASAMPANAFENPKDVLGKRAAATIPTGSPVLRSNFLTGSQLAQSLRENERAIAVRVDEIIGVGGFLQPGDKVDVIVYLRGDHQRIKENQAAVVLQGVRILAYGEEMPATPGEKANPGKDEAIKANKGRTAVVAVNASDGPRLTLAENAGILRLALHPLDAAATEQEDRHPVNLSDIAAPVAETPFPEKPKGPVVEIYRSGHKEQIQFP